ncbi:minor tail protein [Streptomyces phage Scap1]|uniref:Minor tail protein n=1 Tax=Streptomyces phage Scap1 TaxID=2041354 RepID=A0A2D1GNT7_9CAUD|nr:minor tail protein [Streptomyces phage Scap1]ATN93670.1 minor tail protein [Streptomyces phage Scap1]
MEAYVLDPLLRRIAVIDQFESLIWTERFAAFGDFQMDIVSTPGMRTLLSTGTLLAMNESYRIMTVETVEDEVDSDGRRMLSVKGRSIEALLLDRVAKNSTEDLTTSPKWVITDPPATVARKIFHDICVTGVLDPSDVIPFVVEGSFLPPSTVVEPIDPITVELEPTTVYDAIEDICNVWSMGFRLVRNFDASELWFDVYTGSNRTTGQAVLPPVIFTPSLDNLQNTKELTTIDKSKNVAYVYSPAGFLKVYAPGADEDTEGFERHVLVVNANDVTSETTDIPGALLQKGMEELSKNRVSQSLDGEIAQNSQFKYGVHYNLGDIVEMRTDNATNNMRVTEQIFVSDREGERAYPTLSLNTFITTGSWLSWLNNKQWIELTTEEWIDQP